MGERRHAYKIITKNRDGTDVNVPPHENKFLSLSAS
jgi:hypothetical protein